MSGTSTGALVGGIGHIAVNTPDLDRFRTFYEGVLGLPAGEVDRMDHPPFFHHTTFAVAEGLVLHVVEVPGYDPVADGLTGEIGHRGRIDHLAFSVADEAALAEVASRLRAAGASDGATRALGDLLSVYAEDPDGLAFEVTCPLPTG